jgi:anti-sigma-28 factor FlgM
MVQELRKTIAHGRYVVDENAVAEAMLARRRIGFTSSGVFVAPEPLEGTAFRVPEGDPRAGKDGA